MSNVSTRAIVLALLGGIGPAPFTADARGAPAVVREDDPAFSQCMYDCGEQGSEDFHACRDLRGPAATDCRVAATSKRAACMRDCEEGAAQRTKKSVGFLTSECREADRVHGKLWTKPRVASATPARRVLERRHYAISRAGGDARCVLDELEVTVENSGSPIQVAIWWQLEGFAAAGEAGPNSIRVAATNGAPSGQQSYKRIPDVKDYLVAKGRTIRSYPLALDGDSTATFQAGDVTAGDESGPVSLGDVIDDVALSGSAIRVTNHQQIIQTADVGRFGTEALTGDRETKWVYCAVPCSNGFPTCVGLRRGSQEGWGNKLVFRMSQPATPSSDKQLAARCTAAWQAIRRKAPR
jgi:hypothetical protein